MDPSSISIDSVDQLSIENLIKNWSTWQKWQLFLTKSRPPQVLGNRAPWRTHLASFIESTPVHFVVLALLLIDLIFTILELSSSLLISCSPRKKSKIELQVWYHWGGIAILSLLSAKALALAVALGGAFFRRPGYVIDGAVVMGALVLEALLESKGGGLIVVVSLWRVARVIESVFELSHDKAIEAQIQDIVSQFEVLREENAKLLEAIADKDETIEKLQEEIDQFRQSL